MRTYVRGLLTAIAIPCIVGCNLDAQVHSRSESGRPEYSVCSERYYCDVSMMEVFASYDELHEKHIRTVGILGIGFEANRLAFNADSYHGTILHNSLAIQLDAEQMESFEHYAGKYVIVEGVFQRGNSRYGLGVIKQIGRLEPHPSFPSD